MRAVRQPSAATARVLRSHPLGRGLKYAYLFGDLGLNCREIVNFARPSALPVVSGSALTLATTHRFGRGIANNATNASHIDVNPSGGGGVAAWTRNQSRYTIACLCKALALPGSGVIAQMMWEEVNGGTGARTQFALVNNALGTTGTNWTFSFRDTDVASIANVNFGSGSRVSVGDEVVLVGTFDSVAGVHNLYVNSLLEGTLSAAKSAVSNTESGGASFLANGISTGSFNGVVCAAYVWPGVVLSQAQVSMLSAHPYGMFVAPRRSVLMFIDKAVLAVTEAGDTLAGTATAKIAASFSATEAGDTLSSTAKAKIAAVFSVTEVGDSLSATGTVRVTAALSITESGDTLSAAAVAKIAAALSETEAGDSLVASAVATIRASLSTTESGDTLAAAAKAAIAAALSSLEAGDSLSATGTALIAGQLVQTEAGDTLSATAKAAIAALLNAVEQGDTLSSSATSGLTATLSITEAGDVLVSEAIHAATAPIAARCSISDVASVGLVADVACFAFVGDAANAADLLDEAA